MSNAMAVVQQILLSLSPSRSPAHFSIFSRTRFFLSSQMKRLSCLFTLFIVPSKNELRARLGENDCVSIDTVHPASLCSHGMMAGDVPATLFIKRGWWLKTISATLDILKSACLYQQTSVSGSLRNNSYSVLQITRLFFFLKEILSSYSW